MEYLNHDDVKIIIPKIIMAIISGYKASTVAPFIIIPRTIIIKYRRGFRYVIYCTASGILAIGAKNPDVNIVKIEKNHA